MTRVIQKEGKRGSLKWIQKLVNDHPELINAQVASALRLPNSEQITWLSPLQDDEYAEYRDADFLNLLGITLKQRSLDSFWPRLGPQWDGLAKSESGKVFLVEAKSHVDEMISPPTQASVQSRKIIEQSLNETKDYLEVVSPVPWSDVFYQYANRLAHLYLLHELNEVDAYLVFLYFMNDEEMDGPETIREWTAAKKILESALRLNKKHMLSKRVLDVFIDVNGL